MSWNTATLSSRRRSVSVTVDAEVDISIDDVPTEDLVTELETRDDRPRNAYKGMEAFPEGTMLDIYELLETGRFDEALVMVDRVLRPKFQDLKACEQAYKAALSRHES